jgi:nicotinamide-nucleotide amidase
VQQLLPLAEQAGALLKARTQTIAVAESSAGGLINAALLAVPGASAYCRGGMVIYTRYALMSLRNLREDMMQGIRASSEPYALLKARVIREHLSADWGLSESGAAGPTGNRYGDAPGHSCLAVVGGEQRSLTLETGSADRMANMYAFAAAGLKLLIDCLEKKSA